jgi:hypothetical protein
VRNANISGIHAHEVVPIRRDGFPPSHRATTCGCASACFKDGVEEEDRHLINHSHMTKEKNSFFFFILSSDIIFRFHSYFPPLHLLYTVVAFPTAGVSKLLKTRKNVTLYSRFFFQIPFPI